MLTTTMTAHLTWHFIIRSSTITLQVRAIDGGFRARSSSARAVVATRRAAAALRAVAAL